MSKQYTYIDLFAGCGGLSLGLHNAGWKGLFAIEKSKDAFKTLKHNLIDRKKHFDWPAWLPQTNLEIDYVLRRYKKDLSKLKGKVDLVAGGPPCQGFSSAGLRKEDDVRNGLIKSYLRFVMYVKPKVIFFENVKGFTLKFEKNKSKGIAYSQYVLRTLRKMGYEVEGRMINFSEYGIPQKRTRFILVGVRKDIYKKAKINSEQFFSLISKNKAKFLEQKSLPQNPKLCSAISDLLKTNGLIPTPDRKGFYNGVYSPPKSDFQRYMRSDIKYLTPDSHSFANHTNQIRDRFEYILQNQEGNKNINDQVRKKFKISKHTIIPLCKNQKTPTITTLPDDYIHYSEPRILTVREYARIQTFPDWYEFQGKYTTGGKLRTQEVPRYSQIGNAIPPLFGEQTGLILKKLVR